MRHLRLLVAAAIFSFYVLAFVLDRAAGVIYCFLALLSIAAITAGRRIAGQSFWQFSRQHWLLALAMAAPLLATLANLASTGRFDARSIDMPSRLAMFAPIFWLMQSLPNEYIKRTQWAFPVAAVLSALKMHVLTGGGDTRYGSDFIPIIVFSEISLLLGFFSAFSIALDSKQNKIGKALKLMATCTALYAAYISGSRGPWLSIPILATIGFVATKEVHLKYRTAAVVALVSLAIAVSSFSGIVKERLALVQSDISQYAQGTNVDTSLGVRFQIWRGSWVMFKEHPIFGVGVRGYEPALKELANRKLISPFTATFPHSHNEVLFMMARLGLFGLMAILAVYLIPIYYFMREMRHPHKEIRGSAAMGLALCFGILVLGLTDVVFLWWEIFPLYALSVAFFLTQIAKNKEFPRQRQDAAGRSGTSLHLSVPTVP